MSVRGSNSRNNAGGVVTHQVLPNQHLFIVHLWFCFGFMQPGEQHTKTTTISTQNCKKIFIQRDYSEGCNVKFMTRFPAELQVPKFYFATLEGCCYQPHGIFLGQNWAWAIWVYGQDDEFDVCRSRKSQLRYVLRGRDGLSHCLPHLLLLRNPLREVPQKRR